MFMQRVGITLPVVQAPIGAAATPALAAAVSEAGGLGMLALTWSTVDQIRRRIRETRQRTSRPFGANLVLAWPQHERLAACLEEGVQVVSTFWGNPAHYSPLIHQGGALHVHTVGSADEARRAVDVGVDVVVAQGWEAGGHVWGTVTTLALVPAVVDAVHPVPVLAAGGIADGRGLAAVMALGATAGWVGTRFLLAQEAAAHPDYQAMVATATETDTVHGIVFDDGWPDAPHRAIRNSTIAAWEAAGRPGPGRRPGENEILAVTATGTQLRRYGVALPTVGLTGDVEPMAMYAGQGVALVNDVQPAATIARALANDARSILDRLSTQH
jgi:NAD(P)H-dependent flavin oxidoreductase YrpB (nitropropane dioxygenase family)